jgi:hypothetical protein
MSLAQGDNLSQGKQFLELHKYQHGGMSPYPSAVTGSVLTGSMVASARTGPLDTAIGQIQGMQDGGARRRRNRSRRNRNRSNKNRKNKSNRNRRNRNHHGGAMAFSGSPVSESSMLLPSGLEKQAALNHDWDAARNPNYWAPKQ